MFFNVQVVKSASAQELLAKELLVKSLSSRPVNTGPLEVGKKIEKTIRFCFVKKKVGKNLCVVTGFARPVPGDWYEGGGQGVTQAAYRERPKRGFGRRWCESKSKKRNFEKY